MIRIGRKRRAGRLAPTLLAGLAIAAASASAKAQQYIPPSPPETTLPLPTIGAAEAPGTAVVGGAPASAPAPAPLLAPEVQVVRFSLPEGVRVEMLAPATEALPPSDRADEYTFALKMGTGYRLKLTNLPNRPGAEIYPVIEVVGHLHRPVDIDPVKFPIRVLLRLEDIEDVVDTGRLVTHVIYLEEPENAIPVDLKRDEIPVATLNAAEDPLKVASALGRVMAVIRLGGRRPTPDELSVEANGGATFLPVGNTPCPFTVNGGDQCNVPCGPVRGTPPPRDRPWLPGDEYLCDGGDGGTPVHFGGDGGLRGIDPRDAVIKFRAEPKANFFPDRPRVLPTNRVCIYAPRFAAVRMGTGLNENKAVVGLRNAEYVARMDTATLKQGPIRVDQNQTAEMNRHRLRASGVLGRVYVGEHSELRVLSGYDTPTSISGYRIRQLAEISKTRQKVEANTTRIAAVTFNKPESVNVTGIVEGAGQMVMNWKPRETVGVEEPPAKPGLAVIKRVDATTAEPGDTVTFSITYRNMGNTPIGSVSIVDSLLPRLKYVANSGQGPKGAVFTAEENRVGSTELRWDLPGKVAPGEEGAVMFKAIVR
ncbi:DUF11 domain-containing protein [Isosphaeraceae bacterium EP7]